MPERDEGGLTFDAHELVSARDAARNFSNLVQRLQNGEEKRFVILHRNKPTAILTAFPKLECGCGLPMDQYGCPGGH